MKAAKKITKARTGLVLDAPFFGSLSLNLLVVEDKTCPTMWTDGQSLGYNPKFVDGLSLSQTKGILAHEVMHLACGHQARRGNRKHGKWNVAGDFAINGIITKAGFELTDDACIDPKYDGMSSEKIYTLLPKGGGQGPGDDKGGGTPGKPSSDPGGNGEVRDAPPQSGHGRAEQSDLDQSEEIWKVRAIQAAQQAKGMGDHSGAIDTFVKSLLEPKLDWKELLREFIEQTAKNDYTWMVPNRRYLSLGLYLPSLNGGLELEKAITGVDSSGSVYQKEFDQYGAELNSILEEYSNIELTALCFDTEVKDRQVFKHEDLPVQLKAKAGGGTDFRPVFKEIKESGETPKFLIMFTDMECSRFPEDHPEYPVLWIRTGKCGSTPPFGQMIDIDI